MDPHRLREQGASAAEKIMLDSARNDEPPDGAARQMLASLHILGGQGAGNAPPDVGTAAGAGSIKAAATASWFKLGGLTLAGIVGLGVAGVVVHSRPEKPMVTQPIRPPEPANPPEPKLMEASRQEGRPAFPALPVEANRAKSPPGEARRIAKAIPAEPSLGAELRYLDLARTAMDAHNLAAAQRALDGYRRRFPQGRLEPEATVLRLAVLVAQGKGAAARSLGSQLLADHAYQAYQSRIRSLLHNASDDRAAE